MRGRIFGFLSKGNRKFPGAQINSSVFLFIVLLILSCVLLFLSTRDFMLGTKNAGLSVFSGIRNGIYELSSAVSRTVLSIRELSDLRRQYDDLLKLLDRFEELERSNVEIIQENIRLREQFDSVNTLRYRRIPAQISGRDPNNLFSAIVINKGSTSGVSNNMPVVAWQNGTQALVGKVIRTGAFESLVMPIFDINSLVSCRLSVSRYEGIIEGMGNSETPLLMRFVPGRARDEISIGDIVVTSGMGGIFPAGINIGRISGINTLEFETTLELDVVPMIDFSRLEYIFVIETELSISDSTGTDDG